MIPANTPVGTICRMLESSGSLPAGTEIEIKENDGSIYPFRSYSKTYDDYEWLTPEQLEIIYPTPISPLTQLISNISNLKL